MQLKRPLKLNIIFFYLISIILLISVGLYNGFPMVESDTGSYIDTAIANAFPKDRTPFYGWFVRYSSFKVSLWFTIMAQGLILSYLLLRYMELLKNGKLELNQSLTNIIIISSFTTISWIVCYIMPDVFTSILLLAVVLYILGNKNNWWHHTKFFILIFGATIIHNSHFATMTLFAVLFLAFAAIKRSKEYLIKGAVIVSAPIIFYFMTCSLNAANGLGYTFSKTSHAFLVSRLAEMGILKQYLDVNCGTKNYKICKYKDQIPSYSWDYLWGGESPMQKAGGWDSTKAENEVIIHDVMTTFHFQKMVVEKSILGTVREFALIQIQDKAQPFSTNTNPWWQVKVNYAHEFNEYNTSMQNSNVLFATQYNIWTTIFLVISTIWVLFNFNKVTDTEKAAYVIILVFLVLNAFATSTLSTIIARFQNRVFWVLPATNILIMVKYYWEKYNGAGLTKN